MLAFPDRSGYNGAVTQFVHSLPMIPRERTIRRLATPQAPRLAVTALAVSALLWVGLMTVAARADTIGSRDAEQGATESCPEEASDCLLAGRVTVDRELLGRLARLLHAADGRTQPADLADALATRVGLPDAHLLDLSRPVHFFYLAPAKYPHPWAFRFTTTDAAQLRRTLADADGTFVQLEGAVATLACNEDAAAACRAVGPGSALAELPEQGQLCLRVDVQRLLEVFNEEVDQQVQLMKERMEATLHRPSVPEVPPGEAAEFQAQLDRLFLVARQVAYADLWMEITEERALIGLRATPLPGSLLDLLVSAQPPGSFDALRRCPADALLVLFHRLRAGRTLLEAPLAGITQALGNPQPGAEPTAEVFAVLPRADDGSHIQLLLHSETRPGCAARLWHTLQAPQPAGHYLPFTLSPTRAGPHDATETQMAKVVPTETSAALIHWLFGPDPTAALEVDEGGASLVVGGNPLGCIQEVRSLKGQMRSSLGHEAGFVASLEDMPRDPQLLLYVAPEGIRRWFGLAGVPGEAIAPVPRGLAAGFRFSPAGGVLAVATAPLGPVVRALRYQRLSGAVNHPDRGEAPVR